MDEILKENITELSISEFEELNEFLEFNINDLLDMGVDYEEAQYLLALEWLQAKEKEFPDRSSIYEFCISSIQDLLIDFLNDKKENLIHLQENSGSTFNTEIEALDDQIKALQVPEEKVDCNIDTQLRQARIRKSMSQMDLANQAEVKQSYLAKLESGRANPTVKTLCKLSNILETSFVIGEDKSTNMNKAKLMEMVRNLEFEKGEEDYLDYQLETLQKIIEREREANKLRWEKNFILPIDKYILKGKEKELVSACISNFRVATNGYGGGDSGHGGRAYFSIENLSCCDFRIRVKKYSSSTTDGWNDLEKLEFACGGDCEISQLIEGLKFVIEVLEKGTDN